MYDKKLDDFEGIVRHVTPGPLGFIYEGYWSDHMWAGFGRLFQHDGIVTTGNWKKKLKHGLHVTFDSNFETKCKGLFYWGEPMV